MDAKIHTEFAPAERADKAIVKEQAGLFYDNGLLHKLYESVSDLVIILNSQRQIIFSNRNFLGFIGAKTAEDVYGLRPGEALKCIHSCNEEGGCGTSAFCSTCGAVEAILNAQSDRADLKQCRVTRPEGLDDLELLVRTTPLVVDGERFVICAVSDISDKMRRRALERVFFHDVLNTAASIKLLCNKRPGLNAAEQLENINKAARQLIEEIRAQQDLAAAEHGDLTANRIKVQSRLLLEDLAETFNGHVEPDKRTVVVGTDADNVILHTDQTILSRVLSNMIRNAVEAGRNGGRVTIGCKKKKDDAEFRVHNPGFIPKELQLQIFQRSFSTKGEGRGLGTYSMKL